MELTLAIVVIFGVILMIVETFIPGGIAGILGALCTLTGVTMVLVGGTFATWSLGARVGLAGVIIVGSGVAVLLWLRVFRHTPLYRAMTLSNSVPPAEDTLNIPVNTEGVAVSDLRPLGRAEFGGARREVRCEDGFAPAGSRLRVTGSEPGNLIVRLLE